MNQVTFEKIYDWKEKGFLSPAEYHVIERCVIEVDSAELKRFIQVLQNGGSIDQVLASSQPQKAVGTTQKSSSKKSARPSTKAAKPSKSKKAAKSSKPKAKASKAKSSKPSKPSKSSTPTVTAKVYAVHLPDCKHRAEMRKKSGRLNPEKARVLVLKGAHHFIVCNTCHKVSGSPVSSDAVRNVA